MAALISAQTIADWSVFTGDDAEKVVKSMVCYGYKVYNFAPRPRLIKEDILEFNWDHWFSRVNDGREYGGVLMYREKIGGINPILCIGSRGSVILPEVHCREGGPCAITVHSHPNCTAPEDALPSRADWFAGAGNGWQVVVTYWGIFAHYAAGRQKGAAKWEIQHLVFIPRCEIEGRGDIGRDLFLENRV